MNEKDYLTIDAYLRDDLGAAERTSVERRAETEPDFAAALAGRRRLEEHLRAEAGAAAVAATLEGLGGRFFREEAPATVRPLPARTGRRWWYGVAAAIALLVVAAIYLLPPGGNAYARFAQHEPLSLTERGAASDLAGRAEAAYNRADYAAATGLLRAYLGEQSADLRARLALGVSLLETNQDSAAVAVFREIAAGSSSLAAYGNWYLALAAVKRGDPAAALRYLDLVPATDPYLRERADRLRATL